MAEKRSGSAFLTMFVPGLILGLVVGGLAGAFLAPVLESGNLKAITTDTSTPAGTPPGARVNDHGDDRANRPGDPADPTTPQPETGSEEPKDATPANDAPPPKTEEPTKKPG